MKIITLENTAPEEKTAVALGLFDGLHKGHAAVISAALSETKNNLSPAVFTFKTATITTKGSMKAILSEDLKEELLKEMGVKVYLSPEFSLLKELPPKDFVKTVLNDTLNAGAVICGEDFRFGKNAAGNAELLKEECKALGIKTRIIPPVMQDGEIISSSGIRKTVELGDLEAVRRYTGRPLLLSLPVIRGNQLGRTMQFPTINQKPLGNQLLPPFGVYASAALINGEWRTSMTNIGIKPTIGGQEFPLAETNIFDFQGDLYGKTILIALYGFIRPERKFESFQELSGQLKKDVYSVKEFFEKGSITLWKNE